VHTSTDFPALTLSAEDLQSSDPKRFQKECSKWTEYALDYDWGDCTEEMFKEAMATKGVYVSRIHFSVSYSQGDYASFEGRINVAEWMAATMDGDQTYAEKYPALYLSVGDYGEYASVSNSSRGSWPVVNFDGNCAGNTVPAGIFAGLDEEDWDDLVHHQYCEAQLEDAMQNFVQSECRDLYRKLRDEYEHLTSEESFIESCECNDITFEIEE